MPNWCFAGVRITGPKDEVKKLYLIMKNLQEMKKPLIDNGFGTSWYGCLVHHLGGEWSNVYCRGSWSDLRLIEDNVLAWNDETAWSPMYEVFELIEKAMPELNVWYMAEEEGMEIYVTNDADGIYFPERFILRTDWDTEYYADLPSLLKDASAMLKQEIKTKEQLEAIIEEKDDWAFHEFEVEG